MTKVLHAWVCGSYVGRFERAETNTGVSFVYHPDASFDISLSLPRDRTHQPEAAGWFLAGLIPENPAAREMIQQVTNARSSSAWDLLEAIGGDLPGGLVLRIDEGSPADAVPYIWEAAEEDIIDRIMQIRRGGSGFTRSGPPPRFSVAGAQAKFTLARTEFGLFWPDAATVSSHIVKPEAANHAGLERIEAATLKLANLAGIAAPHAEQVVFGDVTAFQIERFDRQMGADGSLLRVHAEDMTQALGVSPADKELVNPEEIVELLRRTTGDDELGYEFYRQLIFNTLIGNSDAHGKNYSLMHGVDGVSLSPLYDSFPMGFFPDYGQDLTMPIGTENRFTHVTQEDWIRSAQDSQLDPERILHEVSSIAHAVSTHLELIFQDEEQSVVATIEEAIDRNTKPGSKTMRA